MIWERVGWEMYYDTAIGKGWFENARQTKFEAVFYADFVNFVHMLSILNAS